MYRVQYTETAHTQVPQHCWIDGTRHTSLTRAAKAAEKATIRTGQPGTWANNVRVIDETTGEAVDSYTLAKALGMFDQE